MRIVYIRCPTCNNVLANKEYLYQKMNSEGKYTIKEILDLLELTKMCCRSRMMAHVDISKEMLEQKYYNCINPLTPPPETSSKSDFPYFYPIEDKNESLGTSGTAETQVTTTGGGGLFDVEEEVVII